jgi:polyhydroxyalkanoate synthesis regulator phasin
MARPDAMGRVKAVAIVLGALAVGIALGATGTVAASRAFSSEDERRIRALDVVRTLDVERAGALAARRKAWKERIDDAVEEGRLTEEQGEALKERIDSRPLLPALGRLGHRAFGLFDRHGFGLGRFWLLETAAHALGLSPDELRERLRDGRTLADIARERGASVDALVDALVEEATAAIDDAVARGRLSEDRADKVKARIAERITALVNGAGPWHSFGRFRRPLPGDPWRAPPFGP